MFMNICKYLFLLEDVSRQWHEQLVRGWLGPGNRSNEQFLTFENLNRFLILTFFTAHLMNGSPGWWEGDESEDGKLLLWSKVLWFESSILPSCLLPPLAFILSFPSILGHFPFAAPLPPHTKKSRHSFTNRYLLSLAVFSALLDDWI